MANKDKLKEMLNKRNPLVDSPLFETKREAVKPVDFYNPSPNELEKSAYFQEAKEDKSIQVDKTTSTQVVKDTKPQAVKEAKPQIVKYTTHLKPKTIKAVKMLAVETDRKDYEIVEEALEAYLKKGGTPHK
jgi:hypothetical protein